jgi:hypothetical protein
MVDWYNIKNTCPNAFTTFVNVMFPNIGLPCISILTHYDIKKLYHFFDKQGIFLTIEMFTKDSWVFTISLNDGRVFTPCKEFKPSRETIEIDGFNECFIVLEKKIENRYNYLH